ncbi:hypothetical protein [Echinococcus multilocularis]|uniref:Uncharacterized protein n=1 Tax=Echinococcus multilocularis TaxID=6211 RepID=A0A068Y385_ECHMU|nr:hypothetical protein [Echinococcus multilocularis]
MHLRRFNSRECSCPKEIAQETTVCNKLVSMRTLDYRDGQCGRLITADAKSLVKVDMTPRKRSCWFPPLCRICEPFKNIFILRPC